MIDTVKFKLFVSPFKNLPFGWKVKEGARIEEDGRVVSWRLCQHEETDLRIYGTEGMAETLEVSLPKLLYGSNGRLLRLNDMNTAYRSALDLASEAVLKPDPEKPTRYDLVFHFRGLCADFVASLDGLKHSKVRRKQVKYGSDLFSTGLEWPGTDVRIRLYDKREELERQSGMIQRLEFQLRGSALQAVWSNRSGFDADACYRQYRDLCGGFASRSVPKLGSVNELLAFLTQHSVRVEGVDPVERFLSYKSRATRYRINKDLNSVRLDWFTANFTAHLPADPSHLVYYDCIKQDAPQAALARCGAA